MDSDQPPTKLYRYRGYTDADLLDGERRTRILQEINRAREGQVWYSPLSAQNDPFDTNPFYLRSPTWQVKRLLDQFYKEYGPTASFSGSDLVARAAAQGLTRKGLKSYRKNRSIKDAFILAEHLIRYFRDNMNICCFSSVDNDILMWSYYSSSHSSFCFCFERPEAQTTEARLRVGRIKYTPERPSISTYQIIANSIASSRPNFLKLSKEDSDAFTNAFILTKSEHWIHENEWRALGRFPSHGGYKSLSPYRLTGIVLGCRASESLKSFLRDVCGPRIEILHAEIEKKSYKLHVR